MSKLTNTTKNSQLPAKAVQLKTPQSIIHIKHKISLLQYKLWILLLHELKRQFDENIAPDEKGFRYVAMQNITEKLGYSPKKSEIWNDLLALKNETIAFNLLGKDGQKAKYGAGFISEWTVTTQRIGFKFPSILEEVMYGLDDAMSIFQMLNWDIFNHFSGKYEAIIYKLCKDYVGVARTPTMSVADFREYMGLVDGEYSEFKELNRWTISTPVKNINQSPISDISVDVAFAKQGRKVEELYFVVKPRYQELSLLPAVAENNQSVCDAFLSVKVTISQQDQQQYLQTFSPEHIRASIERANDYAADLAAKGKTINYGAIYKMAIEENWGEQYLQQKSLVNAMPKQEAPSVEVQIVAKETLQQVSNEELWQAFAMLQTEQQDALRKDYISQESLAFKKLWNDTLKQKKPPEELLTFKASFTKFLQKKIV